ncbi:hypothetical protein AVE30378_05581 [Achromobacter veterisilvae]|uniref:Uncharacterized protein n=1 Tax=Achromobacter veterisilvae TaxID=2069367 RepID=A0A446CZC8_9BURK|nr:hypothetical protein AVE30378_05581 [Achromobacter veterisilvae]
MSHPARRNGRPGRDIQSHMQAAFRAIPARRPACTHCFGR